jgi:hypothetical protein
MKIADITSDKLAIAVLIGAGVVVDTKTKIQYFTLGMKVTDKIVAAAHHLDSQIGESGKVIWKTKWAHDDKCVCKSCCKQESLKISLVRYRFNSKRFNEKHLTPSASA